jgi:hypothetical protein
MSHPDLPSTIGVPTTDNCDELLELCYQLGLLSKAKNTWTAAGQLVAGLRTLVPPPEPDNPFLFGLEGVALLRQVLERDGLLIRELVRELLTLPSPVDRDAVAARLAGIAERAHAAATALRLPPPVVAEGKKFLDLVKKTSAKRGEASRAPGVLEHRVSPRLEWLTDCGVLSKAGLPKNSFQYHVTPEATALLRGLDGNPAEAYWSDDAALGSWRRAPIWEKARSGLSIVDTHASLLQGYRVMRRSVGPTSIREVCFAAGILMPHAAASLDELTVELVDWAAHQAQITVSGGRYSRKPELVHITDEMLAEARGS